MEVHNRGVLSLIFFQSYSAPAFQKLTPNPDETPDYRKFIYS